MEQRAFDRAITAQPCWLYLCWIFYLYKAAWVTCWMHEIMKKILVKCFYQIFLTTRQCCRVFLEISSRNVRVEFATEFIQNFKAFYCLCTLLNIIHNSYGCRLHRGKQFSSFPFLGHFFVTDIAVFHFFGTFLSLTSPR